jgi:hypothetical protein
VKVQVSRSVLTPQVTALGERLVTHAGLGMLAEVADLSGLTSGLNAMFAVDGHRWRRQPRCCAVLDQACLRVDRHVQRWRARCVRWATS